MSMLEEKLSWIASLPVQDIRAQWQRCFGEEAPSLPLSLLRRALAYRMQEKELGGLPPSAERQIAALGGSSSTIPTDAPIDLKPGTRLVREWNGRLHHVLVTEKGYLFEERRFASLSHIARLITGAHWSGPRFFGLKRRRPPPVRRGSTHG
jgi:hypothetical protein